MRSVGSIKWGEDGKAAPKSSRAQARFDHGARRPLAVRPGHVYPTARLVRIAESLEQCGDASHAELGRQHFVAQ